MAPNRPQTADQRTYDVAPSVVIADSGAELRAEKDPWFWLWVAFGGCLFLAAAVAVNRQLRAEAATALEITRSAES